MRTLFLLTLLAAASACVSQSAFDALKREKDSLQATLEERTSALAAAKEKLGKLEGDQKEGKDLDSARRLAARTWVYRVPLLDSPVRGPANALVTMVWFTDYQCPFCGRVLATVKQLEDQYAGALRVVVKQNPLAFHPNARASAQAALAAGEQGKFWEMHDRLFAHQDALSHSDHEAYAKVLGLNLDKFKAAEASARVETQIATEQNLAVSLGATGTPAFFINGKKLSGAQPIEAFKRIIDEELGKAQALVAQGTPADQLYATVMATAQVAPPERLAAPRPPLPWLPRKVDFPADAPVRGPRTAKVTIVEYADFQCPFSSRAAQTLKQVEDAYGKEVRIIFRNQPLPFHSNARPAAAAAMAAHEQGKFWQMHDTLFANHLALEPADLEGYARDLGLDMARFKAAMASSKVADRVDADSVAGAAAGANGTPTFFINGREIVGAQPFEEFQRAIDEELKKADEVLARGVKPEDVYAELQKGARAAEESPAVREDKVVADLKIDGSPVRGPRSAPVTLVLFADFQCPFCARLVPTLKALEKKYEGKVKLVFKHQPLPFHHHAKAAAMASMAAHEQGRFWEMHDKLFANQQSLDRESLERYASELGLNMAKFRSALDTNKFEAAVDADSAEATRVGANGTPTSFINGRRVGGAQLIESFIRVIDDELKKKR